MSSRPCNQTGCDFHGAYRFTWPGRDEAAICLEHEPKLRGVAAALGMHLQLTQICEWCGADLRVDDHGFQRCSACDAQGGR